MKYVLAMGILLSLVACKVEPFDPNSLQQEKTYDYEGVVNGRNSKANCKFKDLSKQGQPIEMACDINTGAFQYSFETTMDGLYNGFGKMKEQPTSKTMKIEVVWNRLTDGVPPEAFQININPGRLGETTQYIFRLVENNSK